MSGLSAPTPMKAITRSRAIIRLQTFKVSPTVRRLQCTTLLAWKPDPHSQGSKSPIKNHALFEFNNFKLDICTVWL